MNLLGPRHRVMVNKLITSYWIEGAACEIVPNLIFTHTHTHTRTYIHIYTYMCAWFDFNFKRFLLSKIECSMYKNGEQYHNIFKYKIRWKLVKEFQHAYYKLGWHRHIYIYIYIYIYICVCVCVCVCVWLRECTRISVVAFGWSLSWN